MVSIWTRTHGLTDSLATPFKLPLIQLQEVGTRDVANVVSRVWQDDVQLGLDAILHKFPFDPHSSIEVTADELETAFHPKRGFVFDRYRRFFAGITREANGEYAPLVDSLAVPDTLYPTLRRIARLATTLWDAEGNRRNIQLTVKTVPFDASDDVHAMLTLAYINLGSASVFNFNQQPVLKTLEIDWSTPQTSQIGIQLTDVVTGQQYYPEAVVTRDSYFSYLHLLQRAQGRKPQQSPIRDLEGRELSEWRWSVPHGERSVKNSRVRFLIAGDPMELFNLRGASNKVPAVAAAAPQRER
jgi:type VI protein secretion system component VasK